MTPGDAPAENHLPRRETFFRRGDSFNRVTQRIAMFSEITASS